MREAQAYLARVGFTRRGDDLGAGSGTGGTVRQLISWTVADGVREPAGTEGVPKIDVPSRFTKSQ